jgi:hypothetical protein
MRKMKKTVHSLGQWWLGVQCVELLILEDEYDGSFSLWPKNVNHPIIRVGIKATKIDDAMSTLLHEVLEMAAVQCAVRFNPSPDFTNSTAAFMFVMNHEQFAEVASRANGFLVDAMPALQKFYEKKEAINARRKSTEKRKRTHAARRTRAKAHRRVR